MLASLLIIGLSLILLAYWFRYSCLLLLNDSARSAAPAAEGMDLPSGYREVRESLAEASELDPLHSALQRDYKILTFLIDHASGIGLGSLEDRLLVIDYRLMRWWYRLTKSVSRSAARRALAEMASVLDALARRVGSQAGTYTQA